MLLYKGEKLDILHVEKITYNILIENIFTTIFKSMFSKNLKDNLYKEIKTWLIVFGYEEKPQPIYDKILFVCTDKTRYAFGEGVDIFVYGENSFNAFRGRRYIGWVKEEGLEISKHDECLFNASLYVR